MPRFLLRSLALSCALLAVSACDSSLDADTADLTDAEAQVVAEIVAEALSEDGGGLIASARDLTSTVSASGVADGPRGVRGDRPPCRSNVETSYDADTGTHVVAYACSREGENGSARFASRLSYQYRDASGGFVADPAADWDTVDAVAFGGTRQGSVERSRGAASHASAFEQSGQWALTALTGDAPAALAGRQQRTGTRTHTTRRGTVSRAFSVTLSGDDIAIQLDADGRGYAAVGELAYSGTVEVTRNDEVERRAIEGTIDLEAGGRAVLRIVGVRGVFRVALGDGATERDRTADGGRG